MLVRNNEAYTGKHTDPDAVLNDIGRSLCLQLDSFNNTAVNTDAWYKAAAEMHDLLDLVDLVSNRKMSRKRLALNKELGHYTEMQYIDTEKGA